MVSNQELREIAKNVQERRKGRTNRRLIGYCYQNAEALSEELHNRSIPHDLYYVGLVNEGAQLHDGSIEDFEKARPSNGYPNGVPETKDELYDEVNHYIIIVNEGGRVVEICSEIRKEKYYRDIYVGDFPHNHYLMLRDSQLDITSRFSHF